MAFKKFKDSEYILDELSLLAEKNNFTQREFYEKYDVKIGLRNHDGTGVLIGLTDIGEVKGYESVNGKKVPQKGQLFYRGIDLNHMVKAFQEEKRHGFEEVTYLLLFGELPSKAELIKFKELIARNRELPGGFLEDMILKAPSSDIMNKLARSVLTCYSYDYNPDDTSVKNVLRQCVELIAQFPTMIAYGYQAKAHFYENRSMFIHKPQEHLAYSENFLHMIRSDNKYSKLEAEILDLCLIIHAEHGGGNNSAFTARVVSSTDTDTYSAIASSVGSLKGPKHGGANIKVMMMMEDLKENVSSWDNEKEIENHLAKLLNKQAFDRAGLIYGVGHAVYTLSDPRAELLKEKARDLAVEKGVTEEFKLYETVERLAPIVFNEIRNSDVPLAANVDFYSGFVYKMLNIPVDLYTPIFALARVSGWAAHRLEEIVSEGKIIRPAYKSFLAKKNYVPLEERNQEIKN